MHETKREGYIRRIENALKSDTTKITNAIIFSEEATREILELLKEQPKRTEKRTETHACDCIERQAAIEAVSTMFAPLPTQKDMVEDCLEILENLPSVQPEIIRCKDCKHWRDSDGVYRRGVNAESKCPLNIQEVYAGTFYCGYAERRTDEQTD